jgi:Leucine-rich repeat (LRR) protein
MPASAALIELLSRARSGTIHGSGDQGPEGSAGWHEEQLVPKTLLLHDLEAGSLPEDFGCEPVFDSVTELDLSGNLLRSLPPTFFASLGSLRVLFLGGPGPKYTPEGRTCNVLESLPHIGALPHLEHLSLHDNSLTELPELAGCASLHTLRLDRNPLRGLPVLPPTLRVLHLEGCPLGGSLERPADLPAEVRALSQLDDLQLPDGSHCGDFFGTPLGALLAAET